MATTRCDRFLEGARFSLVGATLDAMHLWRDDECESECARAAKITLVALTTIPLALLSLVEGIARFVLFGLTSFCLLLPYGKCKEWYMGHIFEPLLDGGILSATAMLTGFYFGLYVNFLTENGRDELQSQSDHGKFDQMTTGMADPAQTALDEAFGACLDSCLPACSKDRASPPAAS